MDSILKVIRNQIEARKREKEQNVIAAGGLKLLALYIYHSGPENLKRSRQKN